MTARAQDHLVTQVLAERQCVGAQLGGRATNDRGWVDCAMAGASRRSLGRRVATARAGDELQHDVCVVFRVYRATRGATGIAAGAIRLSESESAAISTGGRVARQRDSGQRQHARADFDLDRSPHRISARAAIAASAASATRTTCGTISALGGVAAEAAAGRREDRADICRTAERQPARASVAAVWAIGVTNGAYTAIPAASEVAVDGDRGKRGRGVGRKHERAAVSGPAIPTNDESAGATREVPKACTAGATHGLIVLHLAVADRDDPCRGVQAPTRSRASAAAANRSETAERVVAVDLAVARDAEVTLGRRRTIECETASIHRAPWLDAIVGPPEDDVVVDLRVDQRERGAVGCRDATAVGLGDPISVRVIRGDVAGVERQRTAVDINSCAPRDGARRSVDGVTRHLHVHQGRVVLAERVDACALRTSTRPTERAIRDLDLV